MITKNIQEAVEVLNNNGIVAIPTETVYGLAGNIYSESAIKNIFETKQRPFFNPLIVHLPSLQKLEDVAINIPQKAYLLAKAFWPGPLTLVLDKHPNLPLLVTGGKNTVAVRVPQSPYSVSIVKPIKISVSCAKCQPFWAIKPHKCRTCISWF